MHTPGHTQGSVCLYFEPEKKLIAGDTLFAGSIGRTVAAAVDVTTVLGRGHASGHHHHGAVDHQADGYRKPPERHEVG